MVSRGNTEEYRRNGTKGTELKKWIKRYGTKKLNPGEEKKGKRYDYEKKMEKVACSYDGGCDGADSRLWFEGAGR